MNARIVRGGTVGVSIYTLALVAFLAAAACLFARNYAGAFLGVALALTLYGLPWVAMRAFMAGRQSTMDMVKFQCRRCGADRVDPATHECKGGEQ